MPAHPMYANSSSMSKHIDDNNTSKDTEMNMRAQTPILPDIVKRPQNFKMEDEVSVQNLDAVENEIDTQPIM